MSNPERLPWGEQYRQTVTTDMCAEASKLQAGDSTMESAEALHRAATTIFGLDLQNILNIRKGKMDNS